MVQVATSTGDTQDQYNRTVFEEVYRILSLCWADEAFSYEGECYKVPSPYAGCPWPAVEMTTTMGAPGEMGNDHLLHKVSMVPTPYQKPHPKLFQAFSLSESTARWCAPREGITPVMLISYPELARRNAQAHFEAAQQASPSGHSRNPATIWVAYAKSASAIRGRKRWNWRIRASPAMAGAPSGAPQASTKPSACPGARRRDSLDPRIDGTGATISMPGRWTILNRSSQRWLQACNPSYLVWWIKQGFSPLPVVQRQLEIFSHKLVPKFVG